LIAQGENPIQPSRLLDGHFQIIARQWLGGDDEQGYPRQGRETTPVRLESLTYGIPFCDRMYSNKSAASWAVRSLRTRSGISDFSLLVISSTFPRAIRTI